MARREAEVMSLEWHLEQPEARRSRPTRAALSERIDGVNENIPGSIMTADRQKGRIILRGTKKKGKAITLYKIVLDCNIFDSFISSICPDS